MTPFEDSFAKVKPFVRVSLGYLARIERRLFTEETNFGILAKLHGGICGMVLLGKTIQKI